MPRPILLRSETAPPTPHPFTAWLTNRSRRRMELEQEAAMLITGSASRNHSLLLDKLRSIDLLHNRIFRESLEEYNENAPDCSQLESILQSICQTLEVTSPVPQVDTRPWEQKLLCLVLLLRKTSDQGDVVPFVPALEAVDCAVNCIRSQIPLSSPELTRSFIHVYTLYLDLWISLVSLIQVYSRAQIHVEDHNFHTQALEKSPPAPSVFDKSQNDSQYAAALSDLIANRISPDCSSWTPIHETVVRDSRANHMRNLNLDLVTALQKLREAQVEALDEPIGELYQKLTNLPIAKDLPQINKLYESLISLSGSIAALEARIDASLQEIQCVEYLFPADSMYFPYGNVVNGPSLFSDNEENYLQHVHLQILWLLEQSGVAIED